MIDDVLRLVLFGLECALDVEFDPAAVETMFADSAAGVSGRRYTFRADPGTAVTGYNEDHEPGTLWLTVGSRRAYHPSLAAIAERAAYQWFRWVRWKDAEPAGP